eukprot:CAMPEP_0184321616 /NCGR_PEP_ID=MMETSP1049-20130417/120135_1 /TAXON_ID=77928 /ORGANISM="Proteomonas sulcata, Strain CCMP704" /LENGTH=164 /DNA_ID=CAMNT_0026642475 /DNA_START=199 /DNA_END=696 /DNA_ORIENTATION=-
MAAIIDSSWCFSSPASSIYLRSSWQHRSKAIQAPQNLVWPLNGWGSQGVSKIRRSPVGGICGLRGSGAETMYDKIEAKLTEGLSPVRLEVVDNSHQHAGHAGVAGRSGETHFAVEVVSDQFEGKRAVQRHQMVYKLLADEMEGGMESGGIHALEIKAKTPEEDQ